MFEILGKLEMIYDTQQVSEKFRKREFVIEVQSGMYPEYIKMQLTQDRCALVDGYKLGDMVKVSFNLRGRPYDKGGERIYFTNLEAWRVEGAGSSGSAPAAPQQQAPASKPANKPAPDMSGMSFSEAGDDDLPF